MKIFFKILFVFFLILSILFLVSFGVYYAYHYLPINSILKEFMGFMKRNIVFVGVLFTASVTMSVALFNKDNKGKNEIKETETQVQAVTKVAEVKCNNEKRIRNIDETEIRSRIRSRRSRSKKK